jgi:hypothetical protein
MGGFGALPYINFLLLKKTLFFSFSITVHSCSFFPELHSTKEWEALERFPHITSLILKNIIFYLLLLILASPPLQNQHKHYTCRLLV